MSYIKKFLIKNDDLVHAWQLASFPFPRTLEFEGEFYYTDLKVVNTSVQDWAIDIFTNQWFIPLMLKEIEKSINKLIDKYFQENPALP